MTISRLTTIGQKNLYPSSTYSSSSLTTRMFVVRSGIGGHVEIGHDMELLSRRVDFLHLVKDYLLGIVEEKIIWGGYSRCSRYWREEWGM